MRVLWLVNVTIPQVGQISNTKASNFGGWLVSLCDEIIKNSNVELIVCSPKSTSNIFSGGRQNLRYYFFSENSATQVSQFYHILKEVSPDIVVVYGTEYKHAYNMVYVCKQLGMSKSVAIYIQGLVSIYEKHYTAFLPQKIIHGFTLRDILRYSNIYYAKKRMQLDGKWEVKAIDMVNNVIGRTDWDRACTSQINPSAKYYHCNESLRKGFYNYKWEYENCEKHSIFISQCSYPIKGFHLMLEAMPIILKKFPNAKIYTTGKNLLKPTFFQRLKITYYDKYIRNLIKKNKLTNSIIFLGVLDEMQMVNQYLRANVFVSPSSIENSPNSLGEAMILGVPVVVSDVGGIKNMIEHNIEGYVYQADAPYMLAYYVCKIFENDANVIQSFSTNARKRALITHDSIFNANNMLTIYKSILNDDK